MSDALPMIRACMGGWCPPRDRCDAYLNGDVAHVSERLCPPGQPQPIQVRLYSLVRPVNPQQATR